MSTVSGSTPQPQSLTVIASLLPTLPSTFSGLEETASAIWDVVRPLWGLPAAPVSTHPVPDSPRINYYRTTLLSHYRIMRQKKRSIEWCTVIKQVTPDQRRRGLSNWQVAREEMSKVMRSQPRAQRVYEMIALYDQVVTYSKQEEAYATVCSAIGDITEAEQKVDWDEIAALANARCDPKWQWTSSEEWKKIFSLAVDVKDSRATALQQQYGIEVISIS